MKPRGKITTSAECREAREYLGLTKAGLARVMRFGKTGRGTVDRIENQQKPPGPYQVALEALVAGWRPWGVRLRVDGPPTDKAKLADRAAEALARIDGGRVHRADTQRDFNIVWDALEALKKG